MCRATTATTSTMISQLPKKRRLVRLESTSSTATTTTPPVVITPPPPTTSTTLAIKHKKNVRFLDPQDDNEDSVHFIEKICTPYNKRLLFYTKLELDRLLQMEIRGNLAYGPRLLSRVGDSLSENFTWRGIEHYKPGNDPSSKRANSMSLVQIITQEYKNNKMNNREMVVEAADLQEQLRFLSEALSEPERFQARQRGIQDEEIVLSPPPHSCQATTTTCEDELKIVRVRTKQSSTGSSTIIGSCMSCWGIISFVLKAGTTTTTHLGDHLLWLIRVVGFFVFCGFFVSKS